MLRYLFPSVVEISGAEEKSTVVSNQKRLLFEIKQKSMIVLRYLLPSVVEIPGAGKKGTVVINQKRLQHKKILQNKNKTKYLNKNSVKIFVTFCS